MVTIGLRPTIVYPPPLPLDPPPYHIHKSNQERIKKTATANTERDL